MAGRRGPRFRGGGSRRAKRPAAGSVGAMLQDYHQDYSSDNVDFASLAAGGDTDVTMIDNSAGFSNSILKWRKLTIRRIWEPEDFGDFQFRVLACCLLKEDEDDSGNTYQLDSEEVIRELRRDKKLVRGPWLVSTGKLLTSGFAPPMGFHMKPIVLKNFVMDREEDLVFAYTNLGSAFSATSQVLRHFTQGWVRAIK